VGTNPAEWARELQTFLLEVRTEFRKVTWPSRQEYVGGTIGVLVVTVVLAFVLGAFDLGFTVTVQRLIP